jgi:serine/threonine-protein kinase RsbT
MSDFEIIPVVESKDVVAVRHAVRRQAVRINFSLVDQTKIVTAASVLWEGARRGLRARFIDKGPGITDIDLALRDGFTTGNGLGLGLGGAKRLVNEFSIESKPGQGTRVMITRWR